jgi:hypothetical protein
MILNVLKLCLTDLFSVFATTAADYPAGDGHDKDVHDELSGAQVPTDDSGNPFRSQLLNLETLEMYRALLNRPLPRLPKLYTLPSRCENNYATPRDTSILAHGFPCCYTFVF